MFLLFLAYTGRESESNVIFGSQDEIIVLFILFISSRSVKFCTPILLGIFNMWTVRF